MPGGVGDSFQQDTKYYRDQREKGLFERVPVPEPYKEYPGSRRIELPPPEPARDITFHQVLQQRKSVRLFAEKPLSQQQLSYLLWASNGIQRVERGRAFRTVPSAGALYPIESYVVVHDVEGLAPGVYHYAIPEHGLEQVQLGDFTRPITLAALGQKMCARAPAVFLWTAIFNRSKAKYRQRAYRYIYLDAGHVGHALALSAVSLGLGSCQVGALFDDDVNALLGVDGVEESAVYMSVVGYSAEPTWREY
ncbi:MAG: SagB/ThcOx family dehydrogenase [Chloroflexota bacterium]